MKDPALLWYFNDWHGGTATFSRFLKGCYMDLLHAQFNNGHLSLSDIKTVLGNDFAAWQGALQKKFVQDQDGLYYQPRLEIEHEKRKNYTKSRKKNLDGSPHMENENEIKNEILKLKFIEWGEFRKKKKKPLSDLAIKKQIEFLGKFSVGDACLIIDQSIRNDWQGLFELTQNKTNPKTHDITTVRAIHNADTPKDYSITSFAAGIEEVKNRQLRSQ